MRVVTFALAATVAGCGQPSQPAAVKPVAGYDFEVRGANESRTSGHAAEFSVQAGANSAAVKDGKLTVNGTSYGAVADGVKIVVEEKGTVTVDGKVRAPE